MALMTFPSLFYAFGCLLIGFLYKSPDVTVFYCVPPKAFHGAVLHYWVLSHVVLCVMVLLVYTAVYVLARRRMNGSFLSLC